jgi:predicted ATPase/DNA-binding SARP family transcriptional activator
MEVRLLGPVDVVADDGSIVAVPGQKLQLLLAALAVDRGRAVSADRLVTVLYGDDPPRQPANSVQVLMSRLRRSLAPSGAAAAIETTDAGYLLAPDPEGLGTDASRFDELVARARRDAPDDPAEAAAGFRAALDLVRGEPLAGLPSDGWARGERVRLAETQLAVIEDWVDAELAAGRHGALVPELERLTAEHPLRERLWAQLMVALYRSGRQADALRAFQAARSRLVDELGIEPGADLVRLEAAVLAQDPTLNLPDVAAADRTATRAGPDAAGGGATAGGRVVIAATPPGANGAAAAVAAPTLTMSAAAESAADGAPGAGEAAPLRGRGRLPRPLTACLGREREQADVLALVEDHRLVTLVGPGGAGKTRLSLEVAHALAPGVRDGVWLVDLASAVDAAGVLMAVVRALGLDEGVLAGSPVPRSADEVAAALADRELVLLVDNCEQVVDHVAVLAETLLASCPDLRVLATSRETLGVPGEFLFVVPPLPLDTAVELFVERVAAGGRAIPDDAAWRAAVEDICTRLDGLPLAVELAAARARHLDVAELAARLDRRFDLLVEAPRTALPRQRTLRAVVDWSYELLDDDERRVFDRLSVFAGGATLAAARAVCADGDVSPAEVEGILGRLADKSLVTPVDGPSGTRFSLLQTLSEYAAQRLAERDELPAVRRRHADWALAVTATVVITSPEAGRTDRVRAVQAEAANLAQAVAWALEGDPDLALELAANLGWHWFTTMQAGLAWTVLTTAIDRADDPPDELLARALALAGLAGTLAGHRTEAERLAAAAHPMEQRIGDPRRLGWYCFLQASQRVFSTQAHAALSWLERARGWFRLIDDDHGLSAVDYQWGVVAAFLGELDEARRLLEQARDACRRTGNDMTLMATLARLGEVANRDGRPADAFAAWTELRDMAVAAGVPALVTLASAGMALVQVDSGNAEDATRLAEEAMAASHEGFSPLIGGYALEVWGSTEAAYGDLALGSQRVEEAAGLFSRVGYHGAAAECWWRLSRISAKRGKPGDALRCAERSVECAELGEDLIARDIARAQLDEARRLAG